MKPAIAFVRTPVWDRADEDLREAYMELVGALGEDIVEVELPGPFERALELHRTIHAADIAKNYGRYYERDKDQLSEHMRADIEEGRKVLAVDYGLAVDWIDILYAGLEKLFERFDAIVTPPATGEAGSLEATGSPAFCTTWTYCGVPAVSLPLMVGANGLPIGVQLIGDRDRDGRLLRTANWLGRQLNEIDSDREVA